MDADLSPPDLLHAPAKIVTVGLEVFYRALLMQQAAAVQVDWRPPAGGDVKLTGLLDRLTQRRPGGND
jgi:FdrA protein